MFHRLALAVIFGAVSVAYAQTGVFTLNIGAAATPPSTLVVHSNTWRYHFGTNAPQVDWKTADDEELDGTWLAGPGGFGYEDGDDNTLLTTMSNRFTTLYIRQTFQLPADTDMSRQLRLTMDWDDGFIAWLDGVLTTNSANAPAGEPPHTAISNPPNHEASRGPSGNPPTTYELGPVGARLSPGTHVLAIMGLNGASNSSDFSLIADLVLGGSFGGALADGYFALVQTNIVVLSGSNTLAGAARVTVNGWPANFDSASGTWSRVQTLQPGMNRLFIASLDAQGFILGAISKDIVAELNSTTVTGNLSANTAWSGTVRLTNDVVVTSGATLTIGPGTVVLLTPAASLRATNNSTIDVAGALEQPVFFLPADANTAWRDLTAIGANSLLRLRHAETVAGRTRAERGGTTLVEDSTLRDMASNIEMIVGLNGAALTLRRTHVFRFGELDSRDTPLLIEDCLMERTAVDCLDIKTSITTVPLTVRRSTLRFGATTGGGPPDSDGVDLGPGAALIEHCLIHDFDDKGVSIGTSAHGSVVRNSLIYNCDMGISAYSSSNCVLVNNTISGCRYGVLFTNNPTPAIGVATNLIVWDNVNNIAIFNTASLGVSYSDVQGGVPGPGNIDSNPQFPNAAAGNFRLSVGSPARGTGFGGVDMGALFPVGGIPPAPTRLVALVDYTNAITLSWLEDADNENGFLVERSTNGVNWESLAASLPNQPYFVDNSAALNQMYFYRVRAENSSGISPWSNVASGIREQPTIFVGGTLAQNTTWSRDMGLIVVSSNLIVPANVTLTLLPGTTVLVTNGFSIRAGSGGTIDIAGTTTSPVSIGAANPAQTWGELSAQGAGASLTMRFAEVARGQVTVYSNAAGLFEDSYFHDYRITGGSIFTSPIMLTHFAAPVTIRRCHFREYHETLYRNSLMTIEDSLYERIWGDGLDFDGTLIGSVLRRCTFRLAADTTVANIDAVDVGNDGSRFSFGTIVEDCLMYGFPRDKGVSIGDGSQGIIVRNCLIYGCDSGVAVKDNCTAEVSQCTIANNGFGFKNFNKANPGAPTGGGHITNSWNNILWNNVTNVSLPNASTLAADHSDLGTNYPGAGNINIDPLFLNVAARDYRLTAGSPCLGTGRDGADMGARFPVGAPMASSHPAFQAIHRTDFGVRLILWVDPERTYTIYYSSTPTGPWTELQDIPSPVRPTLTEVFDPLPPHANPDNRFYRIAW